MISIIVAVSDDWGIGLNNDLLWNLPEDLKRFRRLTTGNTIVMGKRTWESLPKRPLPGRINIVITDNQKETFEGAVTAYSIEDAINKSGGDGEVFIIGGGSIYRQFMPFADRLYITHVHKKTQADVYFPVIDPVLWKAVSTEEFVSDSPDAIPYSYVIYQRRSVI